MTQAKISEEMLNKNFKGMTIEIYPIAFLVIYPSKTYIEFSFFVSKYLPFEEDSHNFVENN